MVNAVYRLCMRCKSSFSCFPFDSFHLSLLLVTSNLLVTLSKHSTAQSWEVTLLNLQAAIDWVDFQHSRDQNSSWPWQNAEMSLKQDFHSNKDRSKALCSRKTALTYADVGWGMINKVEILLKKKQDANGWLNTGQAIAKGANTLGCVNRSVVWKALLSPSNSAAISAGVAAPAWARHSRDMGLLIETAAKIIRDLMDEMCKEGVKESSGIIYRRGSRG